MNWLSIQFNKQPARQKKVQTLHTTQIIRHVLQVAGFLLMPGLFILTLGACKAIWQAVLHGTFSWSALGSPLLILLAVIPVTALWGRFFCGYLCAFGSMQEFFGALGKRLGLFRISLSPAADRIARKFRYGVLAALFLLWTFGAAYDAFSPWQAFGRYATFDGWADLTGWLTVGGLLLLAIAGLSLFTERAFCRYFCPLGGIFSLVSRSRLFKVKKSGNCVGCGQCSNICPMGIDVAGTPRAVDSSECIDCFRCVNQCGLNVLHTSPREAVAGSAAAIAIAGLYQIGHITVQSPLSLTAGTTALSQGQYIDGTYEGSAQGYRGTVTVQVVVSGGVISSITVESCRDDSEFFERARSSVISEILSSQSTDVQTVSGATYSSRGIMQAVANALGVTPSQADSTQTLPDSEEGGHGRPDGFGSQNGQNGMGGKHGHRPGRNSDNSDNSQNSEDGANGSRQRQRPSDPQSPSTKDDAQDSKQDSKQDSPLDFTNLKSGTYSGSGQGRNGAIEVTVKVKSGKVTSITVDSSREDAAYFNRAKDTVIGEIIRDQSLGVQTVSGATMSSNGILEAVANALGMTYTNTNSQSLHGGRHH